MQALMRAVNQALRTVLNPVRQLLRLSSNSSVRVVALAAGAVIVAGCHGLPEKTDETATWNNGKLYSEAQDALSGGDFGKCAKYFENLECRDPFGYFAQQAQINVAYCNWKDGETASPDWALYPLLKPHPVHPAIAYACSLSSTIPS